MDLTSYLPAVDQHGLITWRQALAAGLDPDAIQRLVATGEWERLRRGVYMHRSTWDGLDDFRGRPVARIHAARLVLEVSHHLSHDSAALVHRIGTPDPRTALVHVTRDHVRGSRIDAGIKHHGAVTTASQRTQADGLPVLSLARTAVDMAREHGPAHGLAACDAALRNGVSRAELSKVAAAMHHWRGIRGARVAIERADPLAESYLESLGRWLVWQLGLGRPECQFGLRDGDRTVWCDIRVGRHIFEPDGLLKYGIDGKPAREDLWREKTRQDFITGFKLGVSRITDHDTRNPDAALRRFAREYATTVARYGTDISDLAPYIVRRRRAG